VMNHRDHSLQHIDHELFNLVNRYRSIPTTR
jgi:hypothetical protein